MRAWRVVRLLVHVVDGALRVACVHPRLPESQRLAQRQRWSRRLLEILGVRLDARLSAVDPASLIVANGHRISRHPGR